MTIQWYPGHMHKAQKEIKQALPKVDLVIEVVDARIPFSSSNPMVEAFIAQSEKVIPVIRLINKSDLADVSVTKLWQDFFQQKDNHRSLAVSCKQPEQVNKINQVCHQLLPDFKMKEKPIKAMIMGIPNVGKSSIINLLSGRNIAKVGNEPAVTKRQQRIDLDKGIILFDTPGFLWPKIENENSSYRLAITGAIKDTVLAYDDLAFYALEYLIQYYPEVIKKHFKLDHIQLNSPSHEIADLIEMIGKKRGCLAGGGRIDWDRVCKIIVHEIRNFSLGALSFERPDHVQQELIQVEEALRIKQEKKQSRKTKRKRR